MKPKQFIQFSAKISKVLIVIEDPTFSWYSKWIELNKETGQPKNPIKDVLSKPPTITFSGLTTTDARCPVKWFLTRFIPSVQRTN